MPVIGTRQYSYLLYCSKLLTITDHQLLVSFITIAEMSYKHFPGSTDAFLSDILD